jgi:hypothetical protein
VRRAAETPYNMVLEACVWIRSPGYDPLPVIIAPAFQ